MEALLFALLCTLAVLLAIAAIVLWLIYSRRRIAMELMRQIGALPWRGKAQLAGALFKDPRVPLLLRVAMPLLVAYLVLPLDLIPDIIPIIGQIDDLIVIIFVAGLFLRAMPVEVIREHIAEVEAEYTDVIEGEVRPPIELLRSGSPRAKA
jgi:uncharacterized membrane protein YkvA (DUF1232 family)